MHEARHQGALYAFRCRHAGAHRDHPRPAARRLRRADRHQPVARGSRHPECALVAILDADKEGFLRSKTSLVQTIGRRPRNIDGRVLLYADRITASLEYALSETERRRGRQEEYNRAHGITPESVKKQIGDIMESVYERDRMMVDVGPGAEHLVGMSLKHYIGELETQMRHAAADLEFETAAMLRDEISRLEAYDLDIARRFRPDQFGNRRHH